MPQGAAATCFAPAERATPETIRRQARAIVSEGMLRAVLDASPCVALVVNRERQIVFCNRTTLALAIQTELDDLLGRRPGEMAGCIHAGAEGGCGTAEACRYCGAVLCVLEALAGRPDARECRITRRAGARTEPLDLAVSALPAAVEGERFAVVSLRDISDQKRRRALERIFFHDLLNTAASVQGLAEVLTRRADDNAARIAATLRDAARQLLHEISSQRTLTAAEDGELEVERAAVRPLDALREEAERLLGFPTFRERRIEIDEASTGAAIVTDGVLLGRVIGNMLRNALEATVAGGAVRAGCRPRGGGLEIWVWNPGEMPREAQLQVFQRSFSTKGSGRGLGTYSMKLLTERYLGGAVSFESSAGSGTEFRAWCPAAI